MLTDEQLSNMSSQELYARLEQRARAIKDYREHPHCCATCKSLTAIPGDKYTCEILENSLPVQGVTVLVNTYYQDKCEDYECDAKAYRECYDIEPTDPPVSLEEIYGLRAGRDFPATIGR